MNSIDIAKIAGVSRSTVSRVINNYTNVPEETRKKVLEVIEKYNYVPHASARMLAGGKNKSIGLFVFDRSGASTGRQVTTSPYFSPMIGGIIDSANQEGYSILASIVSEAKDDRSMKETFYNKSIAGGIFLGIQDNEPVVLELVAEGHRLALIDHRIDRNSEITSGCTIVNGDNFRGAYEAVNYLIELGHSRIAHITGEAGQLSAIQREEGYRSAMKDAGLMGAKELVVQGDFHMEGGYQAARFLLTNQSTKTAPTAIFIANDSMAIGAMQAIRDIGLRIPRDVSIIGFDDIEIAQYLRPSLTTVRMELVQMAELAVGELIGTIENGENKPKSHVLGVKLVCRESCAPPLEG